MTNKNELMEALEAESNEELFDFDALEAKLQEELELQLSDLDVLEKERDKIGNPEALADTVKDVVWEQFLNQIAVTAGADFIKANRNLTLDLRSKAHIQTTENFENGIIATHNDKINYQERWDDWQDNFQRDESGNVKLNKHDGKEVLKEEFRQSIDEGRKTGSITIHKDHTISVAEIARDPATNAHLSRDEQKEFLNGDINLQDLPAAANQSKSDKTMSEWLQSKRDGKNPACRFNMNETELKERDKKAREELDKKKAEGEQKSVESGKQSQKNEAFRISEKALRSALMVLLAELVKEVVKKLIVWFTEKKKSLATLIEHIKVAIESFVVNLKKHLKSASSALFTTIVTSILRPITRTLKKAWMILKQGWKSLKEAVNYIKSPENKDKPFSILMFEAGKIVIAGMGAIGAILLGEIIEKSLMTIPVFAIEIPALGSLANIIGLFMGALVSGIVGAIALRLIDQIVAKKTKHKLIETHINKSNEVLKAQSIHSDLQEHNLARSKEHKASLITSRHSKAKDDIKASLNRIFDNTTSSEYVIGYNDDKSINSENVVSDNEDEFNNLQNKARSL